MLAWIMSWYYVYVCGLISSTPQRPWAGKPGGEPLIGNAVTNSNRYLWQISSNCSTLRCTRRCWNNPTDSITGIDVGLRGYIMFGVDVKKHQKFTAQRFMEEIRLRVRIMTKCFKAIKILTILYLASQGMAINWLEPNSSRKYLHHSIPNRCNDCK